MNENEKSRSGLQTAVDFAHAARAAKRIMQAAAASGVHGAAAATAREAFPLLLKVLIAVLVVFIAVPMVIFTALPNIFFGYNSSGTDTVIQMTQQAMTLGGVYMTLGNFEGAQIDSVVTGIAAEYEKNGTTIDHIVVSSAMTDDDLLWVIAINSAAHQQDLNTMSADLIRDFCKSSLSYPRRKVREMVLLLGCVDNNRTRQLCHEAFKKSIDLIYIDSGNGSYTGQVVCGVRKNGRTVRRPIGGVHPEMLKITDRFPSEVSCAEAAQADPQSIVANVTAATAVLTMVYNILTHGENLALQTDFSTRTIRMQTVLEKQPRRKAA